MHDDNVWQKWMNENFGKQVLQMNKIGQKVFTIFGTVLVWQIANDSPTIPAI